MSSFDYWNKRANQRFAESERFTEEQLNRIMRLYNDAQRDLKKMIDEIYASYGKKTGLDRYTMERIINTADLNKLIREVGRETGKDISGLIKLNYKGRINRLQAIQLELQAKLDRLTEKIERISKETLTNVTRQSYQRTMFDVGRKERFDTVSFASLNDRTIDRMLETKWVGNGNYSDRIWKNQNDMVDKLSEIITRGAMTGMSLERMQMEFGQTFQVEKYKAERLLRTEMAYFHNEAEQESYRDLGIEQYIYIATLDNRTSDVCADLDGKIFKTKDGKVGVNLPPMHPNCRSTTGPYYDESILKNMKRRARNQEGVGKEIEYKNYREWEAELKARGLKSGFIRNYPTKAESEQFNRYSKVLKDVAPKDINEFLKIKNNMKSWEELKYKYRTAKLYKVDYGDISVKNILEMDEVAVKGKVSFDNDFYKTKGNVGVLNINGEYKYAFSRIDSIYDESYKLYTGNKRDLILLSNDPHYKTAVPGDIVDGIKVKYPKKLDSEAKLFEYVRELILNGKNITEFTILSERNMCGSCRGVYDQFTKEFPNVKINVVSGIEIKGGESPWKRRKFIIELLKKHQK